MSRGNHLHVHRFCKKLDGSFGGVHPPRNEEHDLAEAAIIYRMVIRFPGTSGGRAQVADVVRIWVAEQDCWYAFLVSLSRWCLEFGHPRQRRGQASRLQEGQGG